MDPVTRYWEIDLVRGVAILMMVLYHTLFDISFFRVFPVEVTDGYWRYFAYATASLFLLIVGISLSISHARIPRQISGYQRIGKFLRRGAGIFILGLLVTLTTWIYLGEGFIIFGILHLIGVSVMLSPLFFRFKKGNLMLGGLCIVTGYIFSTLDGPIWLLPLGIRPATFTSVDYEPLFPWVGCVLIGIGLGEYLYQDGLRRFNPPWVPVMLVRPLAFLGRHSLLMYLVHQPVIILLIAALTGIPVL